MKILRIKGKNLASIAGEFEIDFTTEPLRSAGIFAICGPTGSGKSTLLDAICLALYNTTPRLTGIETAKVNDIGSELIQQSDRRQILRRGTTEAMASVEFIAIDGKAYRSVWRVWRANNKVSGKLQPAELRVYDPVTDTPLTNGIGEAEDKLVRLTGLTYNQFTRTVLLAQNEFARFLKARKDEKAEVLEKLTGTEIYSIISNVVYNQTASIRTVWKDLNGRIGNLQLLSDEEEINLRHRLNQLGLQEKELQQKNEDITNKTHWYNQLNSLENSVHLAKGQLSAAQKALDETHEQALWLQQIESIEEGRPFWQHKQECIVHLQKEQLKRRQQTQQLELLKRENETACRKTEEYKRLLQEHTTCFNAMKPVLLEARRLDTEIVNATIALEEASQKLEKIRHTCRIQEKSRQDKLHYIQAATSHLLSLQNWFEKNSRHKQMCLNMNMINGFLDTAHQAFLQLEDARVHSASLKNQAKQAEEAVTRITLKLRKLEQENKELLTIRQKLEEELNRIPIRELRQQREIIQQKKENYLQAQNLLESLTRQAEELKQRQQRQAEKEKSLQQINARISQVEYKTELALTRRNTTRQSLENARLAASASIGELRLRLEAGKACPVCGSCEHPYAQENLPLHSILHALEREAEQYEKEYEEINNQTIRLRTERLHLSEALVTLKEEIHQSEKVCEGYQLKYNHQASALNLKPEISEDWFKGQLSEISAALSQVIGQEQKWEKHNSDYRQIADKSGKLAQETEQLRTELQALEHQRMRIRAEIQVSEEKFTHLQAQQQQSIQKISTLLTLPDWQERWQTDYSRFRQELNEAARKWEEKAQQLEAQEKALTQAQTKQSENEKTWQLLCQNETEQLQTYQKCSAKWMALKQSRAALLGGKSADETENYYQKLIQTNSDELKKATEVQSLINRNWEQLNGRLTQIELSIRQAETNLENAGQQLQTWLHRYNEKITSSLSETDLDSLYQIAPARIQAERERQNVLREGVVQAQATLNERTTQLETHLSLPHRPDMEQESPATLSTLSEKIQTEYEILQQQKTEILASLHTQEENRKKGAGLQEELNCQTQLLDQWSKLDDLIGSQSGYKFKEIAQGYTLDILLSYANLQLRDLTPRYQLQRVPNELALQIIDHDLGDEVRSVFSLSGGESFLVSLALALGLSSFSARNHFEENLFIDEGFGTLDAETLQIVMEALERLRSQGRQVGVISHVYELAERIPTRIRLVKSGNGKSKIKIEGNF